MKISVITAAYNAEATIVDTVSSVAAQRGVTVEHILVDGASSDRTVERAASVGGPGLKIVSEPDAGVYDAMNKGFRLATGDLIGTLNADDFFCRTDALASLATISADQDAICGGVVIVDAADPRRVRRVYPSLGFRPWMLRFGHMPPHPGFYVRRDALIRIGEFDPRLRIAGDFDWMVRLFDVHRMKAQLLPQTLVAVRAGGLSTRGLASTRLINREASASLQRHGITSHESLLWTRYLAKSFQWLQKPGDYPAPEAVGWAPSR